LREVILQDAAVLCEQFPTHPVWNHPVFRHEAFAPFAQHVRASTRDGERPSQLAVLTQAIPTLADYLKSIDARNEARADEIKEIRRTAQAQRSIEEAAMWAVDLRQRQMGCSLDLFCKRLRAGRKATAATTALTAPTAPTALTDLTG